jgi:hypothetical protein
MGSDGWTVSWLGLALAALLILITALPWGARRTTWSWLCVGLLPLAAVANNAFEYRLFAVLTGVAMACLAVHLRRVRQS